ncbi:MAG: class I SAM-dependent methyltransferase [Clostridia bacterium]|nr:class I SAM-dependent methyltransferase [Clostridia bacterium]
MNLIAEKWQDYELLDTGDGMKLERWGDIVLSRPDPQVIWDKSSPALWKRAHAEYARSESGGGKWHYFKEFPGRWNISYGSLGLKFIVEPMGFKHTGLFPEQAANWEWMYRSVRDAAETGRRPEVLNLFGYTGGATVACAAAGAAVCHVDAAKGMVTRARENVELSGLGDRTVRYIVDDAFKFVAREIRRGRKYDGIIMDPPSYGRGPSGEIWKLEDNLTGFVSNCMELLSDAPLFLLLNSYTTGFSPVVTENILRLTLPERLAGRCRFESGDLLLPVSARSGRDDIYLPCGSYAALRGNTD